jgi:hypothetical protein
VVRLAFPDDVETGSCVCLEIGAIAAAMANPAVSALIRWDELTSRTNSRRGPGKPLSAQGAGVAVMKNGMGKSLRFPCMRSQGGVSLTFSPPTFWIRGSGRKHADAHRTRPWYREAYRALLYRSAYPKVPPSRFHVGQAPRAR